jgi:hypothetical protein
MNITPLIAVGIFVILILGYQTLASRSVRAINTPSAFVAALVLIMSSILLGSHLLVHHYHIAPTHLGITTADLSGSVILNGCLVTLMIPCAMLFASTTNRPYTINRPMLKLFFFYFPWAYLQQLLVLGIVYNLISLASTTPLAILLSGMIFALFHMKDTILFPATLIVGLIWATIFSLYHNLLPIALAHSFLGSLYYCWVLHDEKAELFTALSNRVTQATTTLRDRFRRY